MIKASKAQEFAGKIGQFYLEKRNFDYDETAEDLERLRIANIEFDETKKELKISLSRPGLLIGQKGKNIEDLTKALGVNIKIVEVGNWLDFLVPISPDD